MLCNTPSRTLLLSRPHNRQQRTCTTPSGSRRCSVQVIANVYTQPAQQAIRHAQQEACRQGSMFLAPPHLLQGLLDTQGCSAYQLLTAAGFSPAAAEAAFVDPEMLPRSSSTIAGDLHWAPDSRKALQIAAEASQSTGMIPQRLYCSGQSTFQPFVHTTSAVTWTLIRLLLRVTCRGALST